MSIFFRSLLIIVSLFFLGYVIKKIRKSQLQIEKALSWFLLALVFLIFAIFPNLVFSLTNLCGMMAPVNFLFLTIIFILLLKSFSTALKIAQLEEKIKNLTQQIAIQNNEFNHRIDELEENEKK